MRAQLNRRSTYNYQRRGALYTRAMDLGMKAQEIGDLVGLSHTSIRNIVFRHRDPEGFRRRKSESRRRERERKEEQLSRLSDLSVAQAAREMGIDLGPPELEPDRELAMWRAETPIQMFEAERRLRDA